MALSRMDQFLRGAGSRPYSELIEHHIRQQSTARLMEAALHEGSTLPNCTPADVERFVDEINDRFGYNRAFWRDATCLQALEGIVETAIQTLPLGEPAEQAVVGYVLLGRGRDEERPADAPEPAGHAVAFSLFQLATLSFAYSASTQKAQRKFMGIRKGWFG